MRLPPDLPVVDHHCHLSPTGEGIEAVRRFQRAGGSHLFLATQNYTSGAPTTLEAYREQFELTETLARRASEETGVVLYPVLSPYPVDLVHVEPQMGLAAAKDLQMAAIDAAAREVAAHRAVALGEVGRPHFPVSQPVAEACEAVLIHALESGRDVGCPVVLHTEELDADGYRALAGLAARVGFPAGRLVKHYARSIVPDDGRLGLVPSYLATRDLVPPTLATPAPWFWETDFLDDPARPGAVLDLATVPKRAAALAQDPESAERLRIPFVESVEKVYGITPIRATRGAT
ncbi:MAG TPA: TatD family hydrolase [Thermoplasmata archaeon]|nr:TatD family hydrolase [Thermoplasmata archaeon]